MSQSYDWQAYCRKYNITADELKAIALSPDLKLWRDSFAYIVCDAL